MVPCTTDSLLAILRKYWERELQTGSVSDKADGERKEYWQPRDAGGIMEKTGREEALPG